MFWLKQNFIITMKFLEFIQFQNAPTPWTAIFVLNYAVNNQKSDIMSNNCLKIFTQFPEHALTSSIVKLERKMILNSRHFWDARN